MNRLASSSTANFMAMKQFSPSSNTQATGCVPAPTARSLFTSMKISGLSACTDCERCRFHAFRHGNETVMDGEGVPMATRQNRLGHSDARVTMRYTHLISEDGRKIADRFGELLTSSPRATMAAGHS
jgi:integrase